MTEVTRDTLTAALADPKPGLPLPQYRCHKVVRAAKISSIEELRPEPIEGQDSEQAFYPARLFVSYGDSIGDIGVGEAWMAKHRPEPGGYYVQYEDGYASYSPAKAFEEGYTLEPKDFRERVIAEKAELDGRLSKLLAFFHTAMFATLPAAEQTRMGNQARFMDGYSATLGERIDAFPNPVVHAATASADIPGPSPHGSEARAHGQGASVHAGVATTDNAIEREIVAKGKTAPRITPADIEASITSERYFTAADGCLGEWQVRRDTEGPSAGPMQPVERSHHQLTFCVLLLRNGAKVVGYNYGSIDPVNHSEEMGRQEARKMAVEKVWELEGYLLRQRLHETQ